MNAISLFSGVGGFEIGFERAGIETVLQAERDPWALEVLARHWPGTERVTDVRDVGNGAAWAGRGAERGGTGGDRVFAEDAGRGLVAPIDLVYGGFPCQDLSVAGKRAGLGGERSGLWFEFRRVVSELRPRWVVIENVPGLLSSGSTGVLAGLVRLRWRLASRWGGRAPRGHPDRLVERRLDRTIAAARRAARGLDFRVVIAGLVELGYRVGWTILDAQHFGVPQRRRRVFIVAGPRGRGAEQVLSLCESCGGNPETGRTAREDIAGTLGAGSADSQRDWRGDLDSAGAYIPIQDAREVAKDQNGLGIGEPGDPMFTLDAASRHAVASAISASAGHHGHSSPRGDGSDNLIPDIAWALQERDAKGPDSSTKDGHLFAMSGGVRRLTPLECERLMGWPDDHTRWTADGREISDSHRYRMAGNGVVASVAEWIGHRIVAVDRSGVRP